MVSTPAPPRMKRYAPKSRPARETNKIGGKTGAVETKKQAENHGKCNACTQQALNQKLHSKLQ